MSEDDIERTLKWSQTFKLTAETGSLFHTSITLLEREKFISQTMVSQLPKFISKRAETLEQLVFNYIVIFHLK